MTDLDKLRNQITLVLQGEAKLMAASALNGLDIERVEAQVKQVLSEGKIFTGDHLQDLIMAGYWIGRSHQFVATTADLFGREEFKSVYNQVCIALGIPNPRQLN